MVLQRHLLTICTLLVFAASVGGLSYSLDESVPQPLPVWLLIDAALTVLLLGVAHGLRRLWQRASFDTSALSDAQWIAVLSLLTLLPRVAWVLVAQTKPESDFADYQSLAQGLCRQHQFGVDTPSAFRPVGWPFVLSLIDCAGLDTQIWGGLCNALAQAATVPAIFLWTRDVAGGRAALLASLMFAFWPAQILGCSLLATEPLFTLLLVWSLYLASQLPTSPRPLRLAFLTGLTVAAGAYVRATLLPLPLVIGAVALLGARRIRPTLLHNGLVFVTAIVCLVPWGIRNQHVLGKFSLTTTNEGVTLILGNADNADGRYIGAEKRPFVPPATGEMAEDAAARRVAYAWIAAHPARFVQLIPRKWLALWGPDFSQPGWSMQSPRWQFAREAAMGLSEAYLLIMLALAALVVRRIPPQRLTDPASAALMLWFAVHVLFHGQDRFHAPLVPVLCMVAAAGLAGQRTTERA